MTAAKEAGLKVFRTWGFNDKNVTYDPDGLPKYGNEGAGGTETVFQWWANGTSTIDVAPFDKVVDAAAKVGMKLVVTLTNNWADYGGMDVYTTNLGFRYHDDVSIPSKYVVFLSFRFVPLFLLRQPANLPVIKTSSTANPPSRPPSSATSRRW